MSRLLHKKIGKQIVSVCLLAILTKSPCLQKKNDERKMLVSNQRKELDEILVKGFKKCEEAIASAISAVMPRQFFGRVSFTIYGFWKVHGLQRNELNGDKLMMSRLESRNLGDEIDKLLIFQIKGFPYLEKFRIKEAETAALLQQAKLAKEAKESKALAIKAEKAKRAQQLTKFGRRVLTNSDDDDDIEKIGAVQPNIVPTTTTPRGPVVSTPTKSSDVKITDNIVYDQDENSPVISFSHRKKKEAESQMFSADPKTHSALTLLDVNECSSVLHAREGSKYLHSNAIDRQPDSMDLDRSEGESDISGNTPKRHRGRGKKNTKPVDVVLTKKIRAPRDSSGMSDAVLLSYTMLPVSGQHTSSFTADDMEFISELDEHVKLDNDFRQFLREHMILDLFKDVIFERNVVTYCMEKRRLTNVKDDENFHIDWKDVVPAIGDKLIADLKASNTQLKEMMSSKQSKIENDKLELVRLQYSMYQDEEEQALAVKAIIDETLQHMEENAKGLQEIEKIATKKIHHNVSSVMNKICSIWAKCNGLSHLMDISTSGKKKRKFLEMRMYSHLMNLDPPPDNINLRRRITPQEVSANQYKSKMLFSDDEPMEGEQDEEKDDYIMIADSGSVDSDGASGESEISMDHNKCSSRNLNDGELGNGNDFDEVVVGSMASSSTIVNHAVDTCGDITVNNRTIPPINSNSIFELDSSAILSTTQSTPANTSSSNSRSTTLSLKNNSSLQLSESRLDESTQQILRKCKQAQSFSINNLFDLVTKTSVTPAEMLRTISVLKIHNNDNKMPNTAEKEEAMLAKAAAKAQKTLDLEEQKLRLTQIQHESITTTINKPESNAAHSSAAAIDTAAPPGASAAPSQLFSAAVTPVDFEKRAPADCSQYSQLQAQMAASKLLDRLITTLLFNVKALNNVMGLRFTTASTSTKDKVAFLLFILKHLKEKSVEEAVLLFKESVHFLQIKCLFLMPFSDRDYYNIAGDGFCVYRTHYHLKERAAGGFKTTVEQMRENDEKIMKSDDRLLHFSASLGELYNSVKARRYLNNYKGSKKLHLTKIDHARILLESLGSSLGSLPKAYQADSLWLAYNLEAGCTIFNDNICDNKEKDDGYAVMASSAVLADLHTHDVLSERYSFADIAKVVKVQPNYSVHKNNHCFIINNPTLYDVESNFDVLLADLFAELLSKLTTMEEFWQINNKTDDQHQLLNIVEDVVKTQCSVTESDKILIQALCAFLTNKNDASIKQLRVEFTTEDQPLQTMMPGSNSETNSDENCCTPEAILVDEENVEINSTVTACHIQVMK